MDNFKFIEEKLHKFIKKYYTNEIIKGSILFLTIGLLYLILILFIEYFLWLQPLARTILFWAFILVELGLLTKFILIPIFKLIGIKKGISLENASKLIGDHFKEIDDKLLNILQLKERGQRSDLLIASIEQKSINISPIPFRKAIDFKYNIRYIKYLTIPVLIWFLAFLSGIGSDFNESFNRVVHHQMAYEAPAPFRFIIRNKTLKTVEGKSFSLQLVTEGKVIPELITVNFNGESYYLNQKNSNIFNYEFESPRENIEFYLKANNVISNKYTIEVIAAPKIVDFQMIMNYPDYTNKEQEIIKNTGNATLPEGTNIIWKITSKNTDDISFIDNNNKLNPLGDLLIKEKTGLFEISKIIKKDISYQINTSNKNLKKFEKLNYQLKIIKDQYPKIIIKSDIDSVSRGPVQFIGQLSDDYGIKKLQIVARNIKSGQIHTTNIFVDKSDFYEFYYLFPNGLILDEGSSYEIYFEVFDNDEVNGSKRTTSKYFYYNNKTQEEINNELLLEQKQNIEEIKRITDKGDKLNDELDKFSNKLKSKSDSDWNDEKQLDQFLKRQKEYQNMLQRTSEKLLKNLDELDEDKNPELEDKKEDLKRRIEETQELQKKQKLLKELQELSEKLKKEDLIDKIDKLAQQSKQETRSLERILELTKRFYVEKKSLQIMEKLKQLAKVQNDLSDKESNSAKEQEKLNKKFDSIKKDFDDLSKQNKELKSPLNIQDTKADQKLIEMEMEKAKDELEKKDKNMSDKSGQKAKEKQKSAAKKMEELSKKLEQDMMQMEMEGSEENIKDLKQILENLLVFSFEQEKLLLSFEDIDAKNADYPKKLKNQIRLKEHFEHIDDSLYTLSLRLVKLSSRIQTDLSDAHYNLDKSLVNITENRISQSIGNQQYTMTAANNLADLLSDLLQNLQNKQPGMGKGKGKKGEELSLPDVIKKQGDLIKKMQKGEKSGKEKGKNNSEMMSGEQFEIYKEQNRLKEELNSILEKQGDRGSGNSKEILNKMDELEKILLKKGITNEAIEKMKKIESDLLKLENASFDKNKDIKRTSDTGIQKDEVLVIKSIEIKHMFFKNEEILIRQNFKLKPLYQKRTKMYFKN